MGIAAARERRRPEATVLYQVLAERFRTFLARFDDPECGRDLPRFVVRELRDYLRCGILANG